MRADKNNIGMVCLIALLFFSCSRNGEGSGKLVIVSWNLQNLFDDVDNGSEYSEFDPGEGDWNTDLFLRKAAAVAEVILVSSPGGPDIVLLQEVENKNALSVLNDNYLKSCGYKYSAFFPTENSSVGCGVLSRYPVVALKNHAVNYKGREAGRNISEVDIDTGTTSERLKIFLNHWKSKRGGAEETEALRIASAVLLRTLIDHSVISCPETLVIAAGDFNESHDEYQRIGRSYPTALMPESEKGGIPGIDCLFYNCSAVGMKTAAGNILYNPWTESDSSGSYYFDGTWETIDQFFIGKKAFDGTGYEYDYFRIVTPGFMTGAEGAPLRWQSSDGTGCSDHFPVLIELSFVD